jgi:hypothetical protein
MRFINAVSDCCNGISMNFEEVTVNGLYAVTVSLTTVIVSTP